MIWEFDVTTQIFLSIVITFGHNEHGLVIEKHRVPKRERSRKGRGTTLTAFAENIKTVIDEIVQATFLIREELKRQDSEFRMLYIAEVVDEERRILLTSSNNFEN
jgi:hypothetical protein